MKQTRRVLTVVGVTLILGIFSMVNGSVVHSSPTPQDTNTDTPAPNFIVILTDDQDPSSLAYMPILQAELVEKGALFTHYYITAPLCCPSRMSLLTGQYIHNHGVLSNDAPEGGFVKAFESGVESSTLATWLHDAGYRTALVGKYLNGYPMDDNPTYIPPGWDEWYALSLKYGEESVYFKYALNENGVEVTYLPEDEGYQTDRLGEIAADFITRTAGEAPFFLYLTPFAPHGPATPAPRHEGQYASLNAPRPPSFNEADVSDKPATTRNNPPLTEQAITRLDGRYRRQIETLQAVDEMIGTLVETLDAAGALDNTYIFYAIDNGYMYGVHRFNCCKGTVYEEVVHLPMVVRGPGITAGVEIDAFTLNTDIAPTLLDAAGAALPEAVDGRSLLPLWGDGSVTDWRTHFLISNKCPTADTVERFPNCYNALRTSRYMYVDYPAAGEQELYDLINDPYQLDNLAVTSPDAAAPLIAQHDAAMRTLLACSGETCRTLESQPFDFP